MMLDVTAGHRAMWNNPHDPNVIFLDQKRTVKPDIVAVWQYLPFKDGSIEGGVIDPPHMLYESKGKPMGFNFKERYGILDRVTWRKDLGAAYEELMRVLEPEGMLLVKWNDNHVSLKRFLSCFSGTPASMASLAASNGVRKPGSTEPRSRTWYIIFNSQQRKGKNGVL
jgi:hypothetical protein